MTNVLLKPIIDKLKEDDVIPIGYVSFRQAYIRGSIPEEIKKYIIKVKKFTSVSYYIDESDVGKFTDALINQFN